MILGSRAAVDGNNIVLTSDDREAVSGTWSIVATHTSTGTSTDGNITIGAMNNGLAERTTLGRADVYTPVVQTLTYPIVATGTDTQDVTLTIDAGTRVPVSGPIAGRTPAWISLQLR